jgi:hypothetical protein
MISTTNPIQLSFSGDATESKNAPTINLAYMALREFLSGAMLIAMGFIAAIIWKRK